MPYLNLFRAFSLLWIVAFVAFGAVGRVVPAGEEITDPTLRLWLVLSGSLLAIAGFVCWLGAIRFWLHRRSARMSRSIGAVVLIPYGFLFGWLYLLLARDPFER